MVGQRICAEPKGRQNVMAAGSGRKLLTSWQLGERRRRRRRKRMRRRRRRERGGRERRNKKEGERTHVC